MKPGYLHPRAWVLSGLVAGLLLAPVSLAVPDSDDSLVLDLEVEWGGERVALKVPVGDIAFLSQRVGDEVIEIGLLAQPDLTVALARIVDGDLSQPRFLERLTLEPNRAIDAISTPVPVKVTMLGARGRPGRRLLRSDSLTEELGETAASLARPEVSHRAATVFEQARCCVTCGSTKVCGCAVEMTCGSCCAGSCC